MRADESYRRHAAGLSQLTVGSARIGVIPLQQVVRVTQGVGPASIDHYGRRRQVS